MARYAAVLDACVLYPAPIRDALLSLASSSFYRPLWTSQIHDEWIRNLLRNRVDLTREKLERTRDQMDRIFEEALITNYEYLVDAIELPDLDDRHVVAAAIRGNADAIVTSNIRDFPKEVLLVHDLEVIHPDDFIRYQFDLDSSRFLKAIREQRARLRNPLYSQDEMIVTFEECGLILTADLLRDYMDEF